MKRKEKHIDEHKNKLWEFLSKPATIIIATASLVGSGAFVIGQSFAKYEAQQIITDQQQKYIELQNRHNQDVLNLHNQIYELQSEIITLKQSQNERKNQ